MPGVPKPSSSGLGSPKVWLVAFLLGAGLLWWLWPRSDSTSTSDAELDSRIALGASDPGTKATRRDRTREAKAAISGTIRALGGAPIAGAQVCAWPDWGQLRGVAKEEPICADSGADGHYRIEGLWPLRNVVHASAASFQPNSWSTKNEQGGRRGYVLLEPGGEATGIDIELKPGGVRISGVVKDLGGGVIEGALVRVSTQISGTAGATTDAEGRFEIWAAPGPVRVRASAEGYASGDTRSLAPSARVEVFLTPESVLIGTVVAAETGEPVADVTVSAGSSGWWFDGGGEVRSDAEGKFRIGGLSPGVYEPSATDDGLYGEAATQVHLGLGQTSEPVEIRVHAMAWIEGRVMVAGSERPCTEGWISLSSKAKGLRAGGATDDEGRVIIRGVRAGEYEASVECNGYVGDELENIVVGSEPILDQVWLVREGLAMRGVVVDSKGEPVEDANIGANMIVDPGDPRAQTANSWSGQSDAAGAFELHGLLPGKYEVSVYAKQPAPEAPMVVELTPGSDRNDIRIELLGEATIAGRVVDENGRPQPGAGVRAGPLGKWATSSTMTDDEGEFVLEHVRTGEVRVSASVGPWGDTMRAPGTSDDDVQGEVLTLAADDVAEVELRVESRTGIIRGKVFDEGGAPVDDAFVHAERVSDKAGANAARSRNAVRWDWGSEPILTDVDGTFTIEELPEGTYVVRAHRRGGGEAIAEGVALGSSVELTIESTGSIAGTVKIAGGEAPESFSISLSDRPRGLHFSDSYFRTEGVWAISELPPGTYEVVVDSPSGTAKLEGVELAADGEVSGLELTLQPRVTIRGRLVDIDTGAPVAGLEVRIGARGGGRMMFFGMDEGGDRKHVSDESGHFEVEHAPTGAVYISVVPRTWTDTNPYDWTSRAAKIPERPEVQDIGDIELVARRLDPDQSAGDLGFELVQSDPGIEPEQVKHVVALIRPGGPAAGTELAVGDEIERVDGKSVSGLDSNRFHTLTRVPAGTVLDLELAGGKKVSLTLGPPIE